MPEKVRHTSHARYSLWYHVVWGTKYRKHVWKEDHTKARVKVVLKAIAFQYDMEIGELEVMSDHVHLMLCAPPRMAPAHAVQILKSLSTKTLLEEFPWLHKEYWGGEIWVRGYFVRSVGVGITKATIDRYIREQSEEI